MRTDWQRSAACRDLDPDLFVPDSMDLAGLEVALSTCETCPVKPECARFGEWDGVGSPDKKRRTHATGVWGGVYYYPMGLGTMDLRQCRKLLKKQG